MPLYEYQCSNCGHQFEQLQKITDNALIMCPKCAHNTLHKLVSQTSFQLKGTGWYVTDFKGQKKEHVKQATEVNDKKTDTKDMKTSKVTDKVTNKTEDKK